MHVFLRSSGQKADVLLIRYTNRGTGSSALPLRGPSTWLITPQGVLLHYVTYKIRQRVWMRTSAPAGLDARPHVLGEVLEARVPRVAGAAAWEPLEQLPHLWDDGGEHALRERTPRLGFCISPLEAFWLRKLKP